LRALLEKVGFGPTFLQFVQASQDLATSAVRINGKLSKYFPNRRSARQGCPLSPLLFVIAMDALSTMFQQALDDGRLRGVEVPALFQQGMHSLYADDIAIIMQEDQNSLRELMQILTTFGEASGLQINWQKTNAAYLATLPLPPYLHRLQWTWETNINASKLLGLPVAQTISAPRMHAMLKLKLEEKLAQSRSNLASLGARIIISNHLIVASLWYKLTLWMGKAKDLHTMQAQVTKFIWGGARTTARHRVDLHTICRPKMEGGLGLLAIPTQTASLSARFMLWAVHEDKQPNLLRDILRHYLREMSAKKWGTHDFTWLLEGVRNPK
jgi:hypothetical protein